MAKKKKSRVEPGILPGMFDGQSTPPEGKEPHRPQAGVETDLDKISRCGECFEQGARTIIRGSERDVDELMAYHRIISHDTLFAECQNKEN